MNPEESRYLNKHIYVVLKDGSIVSGILLYLNPSDIVLNIKKVRNKKDNVLLQDVGVSSIGKATIDRWLISI